MTQTDIKQQTQQALAKQQETNVVTKANGKAEQIKEALERMKPQLQAALVKKVSPEYVISTALTAIRQNPQLMECTTVSLIGAILQSTQLGLRLDGPLGHAYMIPYRNSKKNVMEAQFMPGYRGYIDLARRSGEIINIMAQVVHQGDIFEYEYGVNERLVHRPNPEKQGEVSHIYAYAKLKSGGFPFEVMTVEEVEEIRASSKARESGPWVTNWEEMARKTVIRRLSKYLPLSVEFAEAVELDELGSRGIAQSIEFDHAGQLVHAPISTQDEPTPAPAALPEPAKAPEKAEPDTGSPDKAKEDAVAADPWAETNAKKIAAIQKIFEAGKVVKHFEMCQKVVENARDEGDITSEQAIEWLSRIGQKIEALKGQKK